ncbi:MAG: YihY/virulence factor BrkB family protein [Acidobacteriota bacterium]|nr:YihY/virulence factor BrkB family protein [Acidobacteriota bacterium]
MRARKSVSGLWYRYFRRSAALRQSVVEVVERTARRILNDNILDLAAQVAFYFVLSLVPFLIVLAAIVGWLPSTTLWQSFAQWITDYFPNRSRQAVLGTILDLTRGYTGYLSFGLLAAVWSASSGFMSLMEALSVACCGKDKRGYWRKRAIATVATLVASLFFLLGFGLWTGGHWARKALLAEFKFVGVVHIRWGVIAWWVGTVVLMFAALALINHFLPDVKRPWRWLTAGNVFSVTAIILVSIGFNLFLRYSPTVPQVYTVLAGFVILMTWIYMANLIILAGVELDTAVKELRHKKSSLAK